MAATQWCFDDFRLEADNARLWCGTRPIMLTPKAFDVLRYLLTHAGLLVSKDALLEAVWPETAVSDAVVRVAIGELRRALGDTARDSRYIVTVARRGYRFVAPVTASPMGEAPPASPVDSALPQIPPGVPCPTCGQATLPGATSCPACATVLPGTLPILEAPSQEALAAPPHERLAHPPVALASAEAERRQLTVLFCDLVDSTTLAGHLDPEDYREVLRAYHQTCAAVIHQFDGTIAQYLGDGMLVYFGYPTAHEDDAQRAVRTGLGILHAMTPLSARLPLPPGESVAVRLGIHTGLVVVGEVGHGARQESLALGETPNLAARLQGLAAPNTLVVSAATWQLLSGFFAGQALGPMHLHGRAQSLEVYQVLAETTARSRLDAAGYTGLTPLVGREQEIGLLRERWTQVQDGFGQVMLLSGEAGIGKSRLVQVLKEHVATEPQAWLTPCQCSPYYQHTALYPLIEMLERLALRFEREESPAQKLCKLEGFVAQYGLSQTEAVPLLAALLSIPLTAAYAPLPLSPEQQKQHTMHALLTILLRIASQQPVLFVMEDLHWVDPTTLEFLCLLVEQGPTARILTLLTARPDFIPPWAGRSHCTQLTLTRLPRRQAAEMTSRMAHGKALPTEVVEQIMAKTDGVPLFVEEVTKMVLESDLLQEREEGYALTAPLPPLAIPATLHDALLARLDRLATVKGLAQLGAALGREFSYELLHAVTAWDDAPLRHGLQQLLDAEFLYQRGVPPQAMYVFKHALIQETAYQSLLRRTRQQYHQRIAQVLEEQFADISDTQPELLAQHYTAAGLLAQAIPYWQRAGQRAIQGSAHEEAIAHLSKGLEVLARLPDTPERTQCELDLHIALGPVLINKHGMASPSVEGVYARARELCQYVKDPPQLFSVLWGLWWFYEARGENQTALELAEQLLALAQRQQDQALLLQAYRAMGQTLFWRGALDLARAYLEQGIALYDPQQHGPLAFQYGQDAGGATRAFAGHVLWYLGYPQQAAERLQETLSLAQELSHPFSLTFALSLAAWLSQYRREGRLAQERAEATIALASEQGFPFFAAHATIVRGQALAEQGQWEEGVRNIRQGLAAYRATGSEVERPHFLTLLAAILGKDGQVEEGLHVLADVLAATRQHGLHLWEAELYRCQGELLRQQAISDKQEVEACFHQALTIARRQQARSLELRAAMSLARFWHQQGRRAEAYALLAEVYGWFTEGFDTGDLQEARTLLAALEAP